EQRFLLLCISRLKSGADAELQKTMTITAAEYFDSFPDMGRKNKTMLALCVCFLHSSLSMNIEEHRRT
ncbi:hypothetical protein NW775_24285, partial [Escherichia coli]|nr:hypothetical protein [Escherichia coli]MCI4509689.1 hypothetical protein [Escherichia coli]MDE7831342.1 hypothetical protein [Escherichia coli]